MPTTEYIKNVTVATHFDAVYPQGIFSKQLTNMPNANPDEAIIRAINFNGDAADTFLYLIWCNLTNDIIGSFCGGSLAPHFPGTTIRLNTPVPNTLEFRLYTPVANGGMAPADNMNGDLAIHIDFVKYTRTPPHA
jgi:hypothetical protein